MQASDSEERQGRPPWPEMYRLRLEVRRRFPDPFRLPEVKRPEALAARLLRPGTRLLDIGSGGRGLSEKLEREGLSCETVTVDPAGGADFSSVREAGGGFDAALAFEVIEHLDPEAGFRLAADARQALKPGGLLLLSTPNVFKPGQFFRDATHLTAYSWEELGALVIATGFELEGLHRVYNDPALARFLHARLFRPLHRFLGIDYARSVMAAGRLKTG